MTSTRKEATEEQIEDLANDEWMDWETRQSDIPMWKHIIAGKAGH